MKAFFFCFIIVSFSCYLYVSIDHKSYILIEERIGIIQEYPAYHDIRAISSDRMLDTMEPSQDYEKISDKGHECCDVPSLLLFIMDETELGESETQLMIDSLIASIESDPNLVYTYLDDYIYSSDVSASEVYSNLIVEAGDYEVVSSYIFNTAQYSNPKTLESIISLASVFLNETDKVDFFESIVHRRGETLELRKSIFSLISPEWDGVEQYISDYIYPSVNSVDRSESFWAMTKTLELAATNKYREGLLEIVDGPDEVRKRLAITALEYHQKL